MSTPTPVASPSTVTGPIRRPITGFCWVLGVSKSPFSVDIEVNSRTVDFLRKKIVTEKPRAFVRADPDELTLWQVSIANSWQLEDDLNSLQPFVIEDSLLATTQLSTIFPPPGPAENALHIVIQLPPDQDRVEKRDRVEDDVPDTVKRLKLEVSKAAPSSLAQPVRFQKIVGPGHIICCNRPFEMNTIPLVLLHEAFVIFKDRCREPPSKVALACLNELAPTACVWYGKESDRRDAVLDILKRWLRLEFHAEKIQGTEYITDGNLPVIIMPPALRKCKNEHGDPLNQAILYYSNHLTNALDSSQHFYNFNTRFPCILLVDMGSYFGFFGAIWDGERVRVESLTPGFDLATHWKESSTREAIASSLDALVAAVSNIKDHYIQIEAEATNNPAPKPYHPHLQKARKFPYMTSYVVGGQESRFTYDKQLDATKLLFSVFMNGDEPVECLVKFSRQYSEVVHGHLAYYESAPILRRCVRISAEWMAVVMDRSSYAVLYGLNLTKIQQEKVRRKVEKIVQILHDAGHVHGDIRNTNILVDLGSLDSDDVKVHLVDFDWAGLIGEARYPIGVNGKTVKRPEGAEDGELITIEHDNAMVSYLFT